MSKNMRLLFPLISCKEKEKKSWIIIIISEWDPKNVKCSSKRECNVILVAKCTRCVIYGSNNGNCVHVNLVKHGMQTPFFHHITKMSRTCDHAFHPPGIRASSSYLTLIKSTFYIAQTNPLCARSDCSVFPSIEYYIDKMLQCPIQIHHW